MQLICILFFYTFISVINLTTFTIMETIDAAHRAFVQKISAKVKRRNITTKAIERLAWGTDASFYRQIPQVVVFPETPDEVSFILECAAALSIPVTFRAAGTSLSGQSITNSVLVVAGKKWEKYSVASDASAITMQCGLVGQRVNEILAPLGRKFSPDPASLKSAMVGGVIMNNASGMNCGTHANSDKVIRSVRIIMPDGFRLDTADEESRKEFNNRYPSFCSSLLALRKLILDDPKLHEWIRYKYSIKNVTGLNILPLITYSDPFNIIAHLMVGSEGTLAFLEEATVVTEEVAPFRASAMVYFDGIREACLAIQRLKKEPVIGAELLDRLALRSVEDKPGMPEHLKTLPESATAVLFETKAESQHELAENVALIKGIIESYKILMPVDFLDNEREYSKLWAIRSGIFPSVGAMRKVGTSCLIEDVAFHIENLPEATVELQGLIAKHGYADGVIYGHALEGNYHFIINQSFDSQSEIDRYEALMGDVIRLVVDKYKGSLKAEHGTGRNMAPFVEYEWGGEAFAIMKRIKALFDPKGILNPGVIFNDDPHCHIKNLKPLPLTNPHVDRCIECGFCEVNCLTCGLTLSSRQRIVVQREISRLERTGENAALLADLRKGYAYLGDATCAGDGLCATSCPMGINTGHLTHDVRQANIPQGGFAWKVGDFAAIHFEGIKQALRPVLAAANAAHTVMGSSALGAVTSTLHKAAGIPLWTPSMPKSNKVRPAVQKPSALKVVYFPSCINQTMGTAKGDPSQTPLPTKMVSLLNKAGYEVIFPENMEALCCGTIWESKGMPDIADRKTKELEDSLWKASNNGEYPVLCDQSPCLYRMRACIKSMRLYEPAEFIETFLVDKLRFTPVDEPVALHITCSTTKMQLRDTIIGLAKRCSTRVMVPEEVGCCGFAGDKGFTNPEVNAYALRKLRPQLERANVKQGFSNSRTCEIGLTTNGKVPYMSIVYLVDRVTELIQE